MVRFLSIFFFILLVSAISPAKEGLPDKGFIAYSPHPRGDVNLDFTDPPGFIFQFFDKKTGAAHYFTTEDIKRSAELIKFEFQGVSDRKTTKGSFRVYSYTTNGADNLEGKFDLEIWTEITRLSSDVLNYMKIDKKPFCVVAVINQEGVFPLPLNDRYAPEEEWFEYALDQTKGIKMQTATARHILVSSRETCGELKSRIESGEDFAVLAKEYSLCPSGTKGGDLGEFSKGEMVPEFDKVVFKEEVGKIHGPVKTSFGYHLIEVTSRSD